MHDFLAAYHAGVFEIVDYEDKFISVILISYFKPADPKTLLITNLP